MKLNIEAMHKSVAFPASSLSPLDPNANMNDMTMMISNMSL